MSGTDGRRETGERTRQRLLKTTQRLLAERGEDRIRLRPLAESAQANVAAVNYHFGSLSALCTAATRDAIEIIFDDQLTELARLDADAGLEEIVRSWVRPIVASLMGPSPEERALASILSRSISDPPEDLRDLVKARTGAVTALLVARLSPHVPDVPGPILTFRVKCAAGVFAFLSRSAMQSDITGLTREQLEAMLVPVLVGAIAGAPAR